MRKHLTSGSRVRYFPTHHELHTETSITRRTYILFLYRIVQLLCAIYWLNCYFGDKSMKFETLSVGAGSGLKIPFGNLTNCFL